MNKLLTEIANLQNVESTQGLPHYGRFSAAVTLIAACNASLVKEVPINKLIKDLPVSAFQEMSSELARMVPPNNLETARVLYSEIEGLFQRLNPPCSQRFFSRPTEAASAAPAPAPAPAVPK